jgi:hypothetical protein
LLHESTSSANLLASRRSVGNLTQSAGLTSVIGCPNGFVPGIVRPPFVDYAKRYCVAYPARCVKLFDGRYAIHHRIP